MQTISTPEFVEIGEFVIMGTLTSFNMYLPLKQPACPGEALSFPNEILARCSSGLGAKGDKASSGTLITPILRRQTYLLPNRKRVAHPVSC
jgi:hypothetical protein